MGSMMIPIVFSTAADPVDANGRIHRRGIT
jgi:hypothetical protein